MSSPRRSKGVRSAVFTSITLAGLAVLASHDAAAAPPSCPGPKQPLPAGCAAPSDTLCGDASGAYAPAKNPACAAAWSDHCACINTYYFNQVRQPLATPANLERSPSPTKGLYSSDPGKNSVHVSNPSVRTDWLHGAQPPVSAQPITTTIGGVPVKNTTPPATVAQMSQHKLGARSANFHKPKTVAAPKRIPKSMQNIWAAQDTYAHAVAVGSACPGKTGDALIACAKGYTRPLHATPPKVSDCEDFVYNRFYDVEAFEDHLAACHGDMHCKAAIALDRDVGVAGRGLTGSDVDPSKRGLLKKLFTAFDNGQPPDCGNPKAKPDDLRLCELASAIPPIAFVKPTYFGPISGGGTATTFINDKGDVRGVLSTDPVVGYYMSKNPFYDAAALVTPMVMQTFASDPAKYASIVRLAVEAKKGSSNYYVGKFFPGKVPAAGTPASFPDEWAYERHMHDAVKDRSTRTIRDFEKRKNFLAQRSDTFNKLYFNLQSSQLHFKIAGAGADADLAATSLSGLGATRALVQSAVQAKPTVTGALPAPKFLRSTSLVPVKPTDLDIRAWGQGGKAPPMDPAYKYPRLQCTAPDSLQNGFSVRQVGTLASSGPSLPVTPINGPAINHEPTVATQADISTAACNLVNAVLDEWARADSPKLLAPNDTAPHPTPVATGCFANDAACDWDPATFVRGVQGMVRNQIDNVQGAQRDADYKACRAWQPVIAKMMPKKYSDQNDGELFMLGDMKAQVQADYNKISDVPVLDPGPMPK